MKVNRRTPGASGRGVRVVTGEIYERYGSRTVTAACPSASCWKVSVPPWLVAIARASRTDSATLRRYGRAGRLGGAGGGRASRPPPPPAGPPAAGRPPGPPPAPRHG